MKLALCLLLLAISIPTFPEVRPITLDTGESGFFFTREDAEEAVFCMEERELLRKDVLALGERITRIERERRSCNTIFIIVSIAGPVLGLLVGVLLK